MPAKTSLRAFLRVPPIALATLLAAIRAVGPSTGALLSEQSRPHEHARHSRYRHLAGQHRSNLPVNGIREAAQRLADGSV